MKIGMRMVMGDNGRHGFTLVELLVVIAIQQTMTRLTDCTRNPNKGKIITRFSRKL